MVGGLQRTSMTHGGKASESQWVLCCSIYHQQDAPNPGCFFVVGTTAQCKPTMHTKQQTCPSGVHLTISAEHTEASSVKLRQCVYTYTLNAGRCLTATSRREPQRPAVNG
jgi:hypothetical protein